MGYVGQEETAELPPVGELTALVRKDSGAPDLPPASIEPARVLAVAAALPALVSTAGKLTSEYALARQGGIMGLVAFGLGALCELLPLVSNLLPPEQAKAAGMVLIVAGGALKALMAGGYGINRAIVKKAEIGAAADVRVATITAASYAGDKPT